MSRIIRKKIMGLELEAHSVVFPVSAFLIILFVVMAAAFTKETMIVFGYLQGAIAENFAWLYVGAMSGFLIFAVYLAFSRFGNIRLGPDDQEPEFPTLTWFAMLFSAGMGIGMLFFGVAEPMWHYLSPPDGGGETTEAARNAMGLTLFHWCLHPWSLYALVALALAYFGFRRGLPLSFRSVFYPFLGDRIHGRLGDIIDVLAVLATLFGLATSLGLGAKQVNAGLSFVFGLEQDTQIQVIIIACITAMAVASLVSGLHVGIRRLSELNIGLATFLLIFLFITGPTVYLLNALVENIGEYIQRLPTNGFWTAAYSSESKADWLGNWTVFYWGWWIAWSPFVGMFIARVSKGRTIREFITGVLLVPSAVAIVWMTGFGNTAIHQEIYAEVADNPAAIEATYDYAPRAYPVQETDPATGFAQTPDGDWLIAPDARGIADPVFIRLNPVPADVCGGHTCYETAGGKLVYYGEFGVLRDADAQALYKPAPTAVFDGPFAAVEEGITLGDYLTRPILSEDKETRVDTTATAMFYMLQGYPWPLLTSLIGTLSVILFFVTSSDSASLVADIIASGGSEEPTTGTRIFWGVLEGCLAAVLLVAGGLKALQTGAITIGLPFSILIILMCFALWVGLKREAEGRIPASQKLYAAGKGATR